ncbi:MAG: DUF3352 domain-containing protein [Planctomycetes bacterium]|nr:DUF3352 domain-containing protein [Planctomycetota bacterium]
MKLTSRCVVALATLAFAGSALAQAPASAPLEKLVPKDTLFFMSFPSPSTARAALEKIPVFAIAKEPEVVQFYKSFQAQTEQFFGSIFDAAAGDYYERLKEIDKLFDRQAALALLEKPNKTEELRFVALLDSSGPPDKVRAFAESIEKGILRKIFDREPKREDRGGVSIVEVSGSGEDLAYAIRGSTLIVGSDVDAVALAVSPAAAGSLADDAVFAAARARVTAEKPIHFGYINLRRIYEIGAKDDPTAWKLNQIAGTGAIAGIAFGLGYDSDVLRDRVFFAMPDGPKGFFKGISVNPVRTEAAKVAPANSMLFASLSLKATEIYRTISELRREKKWSLASEIGDPIDRFEKEVGLEVGKDFVDLLGGEVDFFVSLPEGGALFPDLALLADLVDPARFERSVDELTHKYLKMELRTIDFESWKIHYGPTSGRMPLSLSYAVAGDHLVVSYTPQGVKAVLARIKKNDAGLSGDADYQAAAKRAGDSQAIVYVNTARAFAYLHGLIVPLAQIIGGSGNMPFDAATIPTVDSITKHLRFSVSALRVEKTGVFVDSVSEGVGPAAFAAYGTLALGITAPSMVRSEAKVRRDTCHWHLDALRWQLFKGNPSDLSAMDALQFELQRKEPANRENWICPSDRAVPEKRDGYSSYEYFPEAHPGKLDGVLVRDRLLLYDKEPRHMGGRNVLFADGTAKWIDEAEFKKLFDAQIAAAAKAAGGDKK